MPIASYQPPRPALIVSDDPSFVASIVERWGADAQSPSLQIVGSGACAAYQAELFAFVLIGGLPANICTQVLATFRPSKSPLILVGCEDVTLTAAERNSSRVLTVPVIPSWRDLLLATAGEVARRSDAQARARRAERENAELRCDATLGRYIIDTRHNLNNALTSVLGNAELLLLDEEKISVSERKQIETIRLMAVRMHETLQRFSSLEKELRASSISNGVGEIVASVSESDHRLAPDEKVTQGSRHFAQAAGD